MNRFLLGATRLQIRMLGGKFKGVTVVKHPYGQEQEVVVLTGGKYFTGLCSIVNIIGLHENLFQNEKVLHYVIVHERGHQKELHFLIQPLVVLLPLGLWFALGWVGLLVAFVLWWALLWFIEFRAECQAIRTLGIQAVLESIQESFALFKPSTLSRIGAQWVVHPPEDLVIRICRLLHKEVR